MALSCFALALSIFIGFNFESASATASAEGPEITYGTVLKLMHERTKFRLHSHDVPYGSGSRQQSASGFPDVEDSNSWAVGLLWCRLAALEEPLNLIMGIIGGFWLKGVVRLGSEIRGFGFNMLTLAAFYIATIRSIPELPGNSRR